MESISDLTEGGEACPGHRCADQVKAGAFSVKVTLARRSPNPTPLLTISLITVYFLRRERRHPTI
jgi:hypothetical protein